MNVLKRAGSAYIGPVADVEKWADERLSHVPGARIEAHEAYQDYVLWCADKGRPFVRSIFSRSMHAAGAASLRSNGKRYWSDLAIKPSNSI